MSARRGRAFGFGWIALVVFFGACAAVAWRPALLLDIEFARQRALAGATERNVQASGHRWRLLEAGKGPLLLLVHGFTGAKENWLPIMATLAARHHVVAPDLPGWGESERKADHDYGFPEQTEHLVALIKALAGNAPIILVGHSMGGGIAALVAAQHADRVSRLVLMDAAGVPFDNDFARRVRAGEHPFEVLNTAMLHAQLDLVFDQKPFLPWPADLALSEMRIAQQPFERRVLQAIAGNEFDAFAPGEAARSIVAPTLLLWCRGDRVIDASAADRYRERIARTRTILLDGCGHMPMMELPEQTAAALLDFVEQL